VDGDPMPQGVGEDVPEDAREFAEHPRDVFLRNLLFINPFWEDSIEDLVSLMSAEHILFGSDYPHP
jgi:hypothetical protein